MILNNLIYSSANRLKAIVLLLTILMAGATKATAEEIFLEPDTGNSGSDIEIVIGERKTIYEYRTNGVLIAIKVVPKIGPPYYMVPADGSPHYESLDHAKALYPRWVLFEW
ncbi:MAG: hypothetical protein ACJAVI_004121 [Candidatus Azotimanducaceae bacterium]|jgi:hypothetical protein